jgi:hypothetical protein
LLARSLASVRVPATDQPPWPSGTATNAPTGAESSAKAPNPAATRAPTFWGQRPSISARSDAADMSRCSSVACSIFVGGVCASATSHRRTACARDAASRIVLQPVHRQRCAESAVHTSPDVASGFRSTSAASRMMIPGVQKPHWLAPASLNASVQTERSEGSIPSSVVTARPSTRRTGVTHETRAEPSTQTVQQPHWPCGLQPSLADLRPSRSRSTSKRVAPSSCTATARPSTEKLTLLAPGCSVPGLPALTPPALPEPKSAVS